MKGPLFTLLACSYAAYCHEPPQVQSQIQQILQIAGISDESSRLPCDPYLGAVATTTLACHKCGIPAFIACPLCACATACGIIYCAPVLDSEALKDYVQNSNYCGARICRQILNCIFKPNKREPIHPSIE